MQTYIALLRGINVSGQKKVPMAELRELLSGLGFQKVQTYIQSGNVIFQASETDIPTLELKIHQAIKNHFGFEVPILIKTPKELQHIFDVCPFEGQKKENSYFMLLYAQPNASLVETVMELSNDNESFVITNHCVYFFSALGYGRTKFSNNFFEQKLKVTATARNYKTMLKLIAMSFETEKAH
ncbi:DUF1697 domain-containing protein [Aestuariivivens insulae]|uniref:DUF1697 domain-containing protein n=1 Tax=Aestuariivivens insulae TaxID=1621988 RepID=UPI001F584351|nr:DUF1697 domain-containing protein [Aestuariivivens insulae]